MKTLLEVFREPFVIGASVLAVLIVIGTYLLSHYYYGDVEVIDLPAPVALAPGPASVQAPSELDFGELSEQGESSPTQLESELTLPEEKGISIEEFLAKLTEEEKQALAEEVTPPRESLYGFGPYPEIPPDFPRQNVWDSIENSYYDGRDSRGHELINRVLIKYWNEGRKADSGTYSHNNGKVYPLWKDTVYVEWEELELEDGTTEPYLSSFLCHGSLGSYEESVENGTQPSWIQVVAYEDGGVDPYSFLDLP